MAAPARRAPATHPTVYAGLSLAAAGLLVAAYAYTGSRVYDGTFAFVALVGGVLALAGILVSAWGRAVMAARAQRRGRGLDAAPAQEETAPTVAAVPEKSESRRFALPRLGRRERPAEDREKTSASMFSFRRRGEAPRAPEASLEPAEVSAPAAEAPAPEAPASGEAVAAPVAAEAPVAERVTMRCPRCGTTFTGEGVRPFTATCPSCALAAEV